MMEESTVNMRPEVVVLYCQRAVSEGADLALRAGDAPGLSVRLAAMPCSSKVELPYIFRLLERGADGVEVVTCPAGKCRFLVGNVRAQRRVEYVRKLLEEAGVGAERVGVSLGQGLSARDLLGLAESRAEKARTLGPNPMKE